MAQTPQTADEIVASVESGGRQLSGWPMKLVLAIAFSWSVFQLYIASAIPFFLSEHLGLKLVFNNQEVRQIHLAFALVLAMLSFPLFKGSSKTSVPIYDYVLASIGAVVCLYLFFNKQTIADRAGLPTTMDLIISASGLILLAVAVFRSLGLPLVIVASVFVAYVFFGHSDVLPEVVQWKGASLGKALWHYWMQTEGVFGVALGVAASMIFLFVLFGALLEKSGAGNYFIKLSFAALGHFRGGPAKAAVLASGLSGIYSGSSIANVVTTGTFTIPLMKKTGLSAEKAGAVEVASSTNGQLTPPVMGAAAFLISEFTDTSYLDLIKYAALPALASYAALFYIVHLEVIKLGLKGLNKQTSSKTLLRKFTVFILGFVSISILAGLVNFLFSWTSKFDPFITSITAITLFLIFYIFCVWTASKQPDLEIGLTDKEINNLPTVQSIATTGYYFLLPIVVLLWCVLISRLSPSLSAYWASLSIIFILLTQKPLKNFFRDQKFKFIIVREGFEDLLHGLIKGAQSMI